MNPILERMRSALERDLRDVLGYELAVTGAAGCYITFNGEADPDDDGSRLSFYGLTYPEVSAAHRQAIGNRWQGDGPGVLVNAGALVAEFGSIADAIPKICGTTIHEFGHRLVDGGALFASKGDEQRDADYGMFVGAIVAREPPAETKPWKPCVAHSVAWVRGVFHLAHRLRKRGWKIPASVLLGYEGQLGRPMAYTRYLAEELRVLEAVPVSVVLTMPARAELVREWEVATEQSLTDADRPWRHDRLGIFAPTQRKGNAMRLFESLRTRERKAEMSAKDAYTAMVIKVADERPPSEDEAATICERARKTVADLEGDVSRLLDRRRLFGVMTAGDGAELSITKARADLDTEEKRFQKLRQEHEGRVGAINAKLVAAQNLIGSADSAKRALVDGVSDPSVRQQREALEERMSEVRAEISDNSRRTRDLEHAVGANASAEYRNDEDCPVLAGQRERLREAKAERVRLSERAEAIEAEISRFERQKMCDPAA